MLLKEFRRYPRTRNAAKFDVRVELDHFVGRYLARQICKLLNNFWLLLAQRSTIEHDCVVSGKVIQVVFQDDQIEFLDLGVRRVDFDHVNDARFEMQIGQVMDATGDVIVRQAVVFSQIPPTVPSIDKLIAQTESQGGVGGKILNRL